MFEAMTSMNLHYGQIGMTSFWATPGSYSYVVWMLLTVFTILCSLPHQKLLLAT